MELTVVLYKTRDSWGLFGIFSSIERAMHYVDVAQKESKMQVRYIKAEIGQAYSEKCPPPETLG